MAYRSAGRHPANYRNFRNPPSLIQHVAREVQASDIPSCLDFYGLLGFAEVPVPDSLVGRAVWLEKQGTQVHLLLAADAQVARGHIAVVVDDYEGTVLALESAGHEVDRRREHWGSPRAYVRDPAGHLVEFMAYGPGGARAADR
jgi:catechol 2,3-dioxygenase-like lactoylglutathione lyase family enzyme